MLVSDCQSTELRENTLVNTNFITVYLNVCTEQGSPKAEAHLVVGLSPGTSPMAWLKPPG